MARPGQAPTKRVIVQPADAVQWSLYYPGIFSYRDLPLTRPAGQVSDPVGAPPVAHLVSQAEEAYDLGHLDQSQAGAEAALKLDPANGPALTVLGWLQLQRQELQEAEKYFRQVRNPDDRTLTGLALCRYRLGDVIGAYRLLQKARLRLKPSPRLVDMTGLMALMAGKVTEAGSILQAGLQQWPDAMARCQLAQIYIVQDHKDRDPAGSGPGAPPGARLSVSPAYLSLVDIAYSTSPPPADIFRRRWPLIPVLSRPMSIWPRSNWGEITLDRAWDTIGRALKLAPEKPRCWLWPASSGYFPGL